MHASADRPGFGDNVELDRPELRAPEWFRTAIDTRPEHYDIDADGDSVHYRAWGPRGAAGVVLIHGGSAHSGWWDHIGPLVAPQRRVVALDLTGHGDSAWKADYDRSRWGDEVAAVIDAEGFDRPVLIGHSMGGWVAVLTGVMHPRVVGSIIAIDSPLHHEPPEEYPIRERRGPTRLYPTPQDAATRFRTVPEQAVLLPYIAEHVALQSLRATDGGWTWKFDPAVFGNRSWHRDLLPELAAPTVLVRCERGLVTPEMAVTMASMHRAGIPVIELPDAGHHAMFDQPLSLITALRVLLAQDR